MRTSHYLIILVAIGALAWWFLATPEPPAPTTATPPPAAGAAIVEISVPVEFSERAATGRAIFNAKCVDCHGENAVGQAGVAPPLVHKIYEPSHHADEAFQRAVALGVRQHHWPFGNMPPVEGLTRGDVAMIISYVREMQRANGIN